MIEKELQGFLRQREQAISNVHAVDGAIQAAQHLLGRLKQEEAKARGLSASEVRPVQTDAQSVLEKALGASVEVLGVVDQPA